MPSADSPPSTGSSYRGREQRPGKAELMEAKNTAMRRNHGSRSTDTRSYPKRSAWSPQAHPPEVRNQNQPSSTSCSFETTFVDKERRFPMYNGERRVASNSEDRATSVLSVEDDRRITEEVSCLYQELLPTPEDIQRKYSLVAKLEELLNEEWPGKEFTVHAFGSTENMLATHTSDLDVCIETEWTGFGHQVCQLSSFMARCGMQNVVCRAQAKVPVVAIYDPELDVSCDMNINNNLALRNTKLVKTYMQMDERARQLTYAVKQWAAVRALNEAICNTLTSYTWTLMVINFLQNRKSAPVLPSLQQWPHEPMPPICGIDVSFADDLEKYDTLKTFSMQNTESVGSLLVGFFHYYAYEFNYERDVASVRLGRVVDRREKGYPSDNMFCIEEPFTTSRNLGNTADMGSHRGIHQELQRAYKLLASGEELSKVLATYVPPKSSPSVSSDRGGKRPPNTKSKQNRTNNGYRSNHNLHQHPNQAASHTQNLTRQRRQDNYAYPSSGLYSPATLSSDELQLWRGLNPQEHWIGPDFHVEYVQPTHWQYLSEEDNQMHAINRLIDPVAMDFYRNRIQSYGLEQYEKAFRMQIRSQSQPGEATRPRAPKRDNRRNSFANGPKSSFQQSVDGRDNPYRKQQSYQGQARGRNKSANGEDRAKDSTAVRRGQESAIGRQGRQQSHDLLAEELRVMDDCFTPSCHEHSCSDAGDSHTSTGATLTSFESSPSSGSGFATPSVVNLYIDALRGNLDSGLSPPSGNETVSSHFAQQNPVHAAKIEQPVVVKSAPPPVCQPAKATYASKLSSPCKSGPATSKAPNANQNYESFPTIQFSQHKKMVK